MRMDGRNEVWLGNFGRGMARVTLVVLTSAGLVAFSTDARACSPGDHAQSYDTNEDSPDSTAPVLEDASISVRRARDPGDNSGGCEELGSYTITVEASDDQTRADELGFSLSLVDGSFPFRVPGGPVIDLNDDAGTLSDWFVDEGEAFDGTLEVRVVDRAGNLSEPKRVSASGDEVGCSCSTAGTSSTNYSAFLGLAGVLALLRRRYATG